MQAFLETLLKTQAPEYCQCPKALWSTKHLNNPAHLWCVHRLTQVRPILYKILMRKCLNEPKFISPEL